ncbi:helicase associated domain-containing protein [Kitasatospora sp. NPDC089509]|uniref:helicase associated domain-containing protein n=1 Tax=Kitasatospora sp. NPDC089509 TaxID=3364079 RepID=UPI003827B831
MDEQRERRAALDITPLAAPAEHEGAAGRRKTGAGKPSAFDRGMTALAQYRERTATVTLPRSHIEDIPDGDNGTVEVKLGVWISNTKTRRAMLTPEQLDQLAAHGLHWH